MAKFGIEEIKGIVENLRDDIVEIEHKRILNDLEKMEEHYYREFYKAEQYSKDEAYLEGKHEGICEVISLIRGYSDDNKTVS